MSTKETNADESAFYMSGLTKREYFAAMAMQGAIAEGECSTYYHVVEYAVTCADKLIEALNK